MLPHGLVMVFHLAKAKSHAERSEASRVAQ
jgi:hypothetical protein